MSTWKLWAGSYISGSSSRSASTYLDGVVSTWSASIDAAALLPGKWRNMQHVHHWHPEVLIGLDMESFVRICASLGHTGTFYSICIDTVACFKEVLCWNLKNIATWNKTRNIMAFVSCQFKSRVDLKVTVAFWDLRMALLVLLIPEQSTASISHHWMCWALLPFVRLSFLCQNEWRLWTLLHGCWTSSSVTLPIFARPHRKWYSSLADQPDHICWFCRKWSTEMRIQDMCGASSLEGGMAERNPGSLGWAQRLSCSTCTSDTSVFLAKTWASVGNNRILLSILAIRRKYLQSPGESPDTASSPLVAGSASLDASALLQGCLSEFESIQQKRQSLTLLHRSDINRISVSLCPKTLPLKWSSCCEYQNNFEI